MYQLKQLQDIIEAAIEENNYPGHLPELYEPLGYLLGLGGKRLRPSLVLMASNLFSDHIHEAIHPALGIELFHNFTLMHDDIMDKAPLRRGQPTVHEKWDQNTAILSGDVMLVEAFRMMCRVKAGHLKEVMDIFIQTAAEVCEGQQTDMNFESMDNVILPQYMHMIELKTAVLLGASLRIGAITGGAATKAAEELYDFGKNLGIAFQLQDDYLDVYGNPGKFGKQVGGDIISNKKTYLLIKALELAEGEDAAALTGWTQAASFDPVEKVEKVRAIYDSLNLPEKVKGEINGFIQKAFDHLENVPVENGRKEVLREFCEKLLVREK